LFRKLYEYKDDQGKWRWGGHIDLWNNNRMASGDDEEHDAYFSQAKRIEFWELKKQ
jgi:hypothetical protein